MLDLASVVMKMKVLVLLLMIQSVTMLVAAQKFDDSKSSQSLHATART